MSTNDPSYPTELEATLALSAAIEKFKKWFTVEYARNPDECVTRAEVLFEVTHKIAQLININTKSVLEMNFQLALSGDVYYSGSMLAALQPRPDPEDIGRLYDLLTFRTTCREGGIEYLKKRNMATKEIFKVAGTLMDQCKKWDGHEEFKSKWTALFEEEKKKSDEMFALDTDEEVSQLPDEVFADERLETVRSEVDSYDPWLPMMYER